MSSMRDYEFRLEPHQTLIEQFNSMIYFSQNFSNTNNLTNEEPPETFCDEFVPVFRSSIPMNWDLNWNPPEHWRLHWDLKLKPKSVMRNE